MARTVQRFTMYAEGHPSRTSTVDELLASLVSHLNEEDEFVIKVARDHLIVDGEKTRTDNVALTNLARRLHQHQLFVITFKKGLEQAEVTGFLAVVAVQAGNVGVPFGVSPDEELNIWPHIGIEPTPYASLRLSRKSEFEDDEGSGDALGGDSYGGGVVEGLEGDTIDSGVELSAGGPGIGIPGARSVLQEEISSLLSNFDDGGRQRLLKMFQGIMRAEGVDGSPDRAVLSLARAAGGGADKPAATMLSLITRVGRKMGAGGPGAADVRPGEILGELVGQLECGATISTLSDAAPETMVRPEWVGEIESVRVLQMSVEMDEMTPPAHKHLKMFVTDGKLETLMGMLDGAPAGNSAAGSILEMVSKPRILIRLLSGDPPDFDSIDRLLPSLGITAAGPMLDILVESEDEEVQRGFAERLVEFGDAVGPIAVEHLDAAPWQARVILLTLLGRLSKLPEDFTFSSFFLDDDRRVRRQALETGLQKGENRGQVIISALRDPDQDIVSFGLKEVARGCPPESLTRIISISKDGKEPAGVRRAAIRALGTSDSPEVLNALLQLTWQRKFFFIYGLTPATPEMLEAIAVLADRWNSNSKAKRILKAAFKSKDPRIKAVAGKRGGAR